jgi:hypothetical protein
MLNFEEVNVLGNILNTTWGRSSTTKVPTVSIKSALSGEVLTLTYTTIITLATDRNLRDQASRHEEDSVKLLSDYIKNCKKDFKDGCSRALKVKEIQTRDTIEIISTSPFTLKRPAYYRRITSYRVS